MLQVGISRVAVRGPVEHAVLDISGELDFSSTQAVIDLVGEMPHRIASIDLGGLDFIDGAGARGIELIRTEREHLHGERPRIEGASRSVDRTLRFVRSRDTGYALR